MALEKTIEADKIEVVGPFKHVQVRTATVVSEDGTELSRSFHRHVIAPQEKDSDGNWQNTDVSGEDDAVQAICNSGIWTAAIKLAYRAHIDEQSQQV